MTKENIWKKTLEECPKHSPLCRDNGTCILWKDTICLGRNENYEGLKRKVNEECIKHKSCIMLDLEHERCPFYESLICQEITE